MLLVVQPQASIAVFLRYLDQTNPFLLLGFIITARDGYKKSRDARMTRKMLIAGNWKMNGLQKNCADLQEMIEKIPASAFEQQDVLICPPATLLHTFAGLARGTGMILGGEDCHPEPNGAHTGDISANMIADAGAAYCIVGHSERRADHYETDELVRRKSAAVLQSGMIAIVCVGETLAERQSGNAVATVTKQVRNSLPANATSENCVIAYEPVWAIGTGETATLDDISNMHKAIRDLLTEIGAEQLKNARILYGGSVKPANAKEIFAITDVDGGLIGGASLKADDFSAIVAAAP